MTDMNPEIALTLRRLGRFLHADRHEAVFTGGFLEVDGRFGGDDIDQGPNGPCETEADAQRRRETVSCGQRAFWLILAAARSKAVEVGAGQFLVAEPEPKESPPAGPPFAAIEPADLDIRDIATALGCSVRTIERAIKAGRLDGLALPIVIGGVERCRYRWRASQVPAIRAVFAPKIRPVSPTNAASPPKRSTGRPATKRTTKSAPHGPRKDILARLRDGD